MNLAAYIRCSTDQQEDSPETQLTIIREYCEQYGHTLARVYTDEAVSGGIPIADRPQAQCMLADAKAGLFDGIIAKQADRLGRNPGDTISFASLCKRRHIELVFCQESYADTPAGRLHFGLMAVIAGYYREDIGQKIKDHNKMCAKTGRWTSGNPPMGYLYDKVSKTLQPDHTRIPHVQRLFEIFIEEQGNRTATAFRLNAEGIPAPQSSYWQHQQVNRSIKMPIYRLKQVYDDVEYPFTAEPIIDPELVQQAYELLMATKSQKPAKSTVSRSYPYNRNLYCGACGARMSAQKAPSGIMHYRCRNRQYKGICGAHGASEQRLDAVIVPLLAQLLCKEAGFVTTDSQEQPDIKAKEIRREAKQNALLQQRERIIEVYTEGLIGKEQLESKLRAVDDKLGELDRLEQKTRRIPIVPKDRLLDLALNIESYWQDFSEADKRALLMLLMPRIDIISEKKHLPLKLRIESPLLDEPLLINWS